MWYLNHVVNKIVIVCVFSFNGFTAREETTAIPRPFRLPVRCGA